MHLKCLVNHIASNSQVQKLLQHPLVKLYVVHLASTVVYCPDLLIDGSAVRKQLGNCNSLPLVFMLSPVAGCTNFDCDF